MRTKIAALVAVIAATTIATATVQAQTTTDRVEKTGAKFREKFDAADVDHDGFLSRDEAAKSLPRVAKHFDLIDTNHDGKVSRQEVADYLIAKRASRSESQ